MLDTIRVREFLQIHTLPEDYVVRDPPKVKHSKLIALLQMVTLLGCYFAS